MRLLGFFLVRTGILDPANHGRRPSARCPTGRYSKDKRLGGETSLHVFIAQRAFYHQRRKFRFPSSSRRDSRRHVLLSTPL